MILTQIMLLHELVDLGATTRPGKSWFAYPRFSEYLGHLMKVASLLGIGHLLFGSKHCWVEGVGALALGIEAMLPMPQAYSNYKKRSVRGLSLAVIASWFFGDAFKIWYYLKNDSPAQFVACGLAQFAADLVICGQVLAYSA